MLKEIAKKVVPQRVRALVREIRHPRKGNEEERAVKNLLSQTGAAVVLDVGANVGQFGDLVLRSGFDGKIVSFEAIPSVHRALDAHARRASAQWVVAPCAALGCRSGKISFNVSANKVSSSVLTMKSTHLEAAPESRYVESELVDMARLDQLAPAFLPEDGLLHIKIDTQGYEMEVLKGATGLLDRTASIQLELSLVPLYDGAPSLTEMIAFVQKQGYELFSIAPGFEDESTGRLLQADGFFIRPDLYSKHGPASASGA